MGIIKKDLRYRFLYQYNKTDNTKYLEIKYPLTIDFFIQRGAGRNNASFVIYNLNESSTSIMQKNTYDVAVWQNVLFEVGYTTNFSLRFVGYVTEAYTIKVGEDIKTIINCNVDGYAMNNGFVNAKFSAGTSYNEIAKYIINASGYPVFFFNSNYLNNFFINKDTTFTGRPLNILKKLLQNDFSTDLQRINIEQQILSFDSSLMKKEKSKVFIINADAGMITIPKMLSALVEVEMILEPTINIGDIVFLSGQFITKFNGYYKVLEIIEKGTITKTATSQGNTTLLRLIGFNGSLI
jgi:hypothetical protein